MPNALVPVLLVVAAFAGIVAGVYLLVGLPWALITSGVFAGLLLADWRAAQ